MSTSKPPRRGSDPGHVMRNIRTPLPTFFPKFTTDIERLTKMLNRKSPSAGRPGIQRKVLVSALSMAALISPIAISTPAHADIIDFNGCAVTKALKPVFAGHDDRGFKRFNYPVTVKCKADREVRIEQKMWEEDDGADEIRYERTTNWQDVNPQGMEYKFRISLRDTEPGHEEIYHRVRIQVMSNGVSSAWSSWTSSPVVSVAN